MLKFNKLYFEYETKNGVYSMTTSVSFCNDDVSLEVKTDGDIFSVNVNTKKKITVKNVRASFDYHFFDNQRIFINGYQSWTDSAEHNVYDKMRGIDHIPKMLVSKYQFDKYGDYNFSDYNYQLHGWTYGYVRKGKRFDFIGSLAENSGFTKIITETMYEKIIIEKDAGNCVEGEWTALKMLMISGTEDEVFDEYFRLLDVKLNPDAEKIFGYTSWYRHYQNISESIIKNDLAAISSQKFKADVFQIDDGYQTAVGDWLSVDSMKFPNGMKEIADRIKQNGMIAGIWLAPFVCEENSEIYRHHREWLVYDSHYEYIKGGSNWSGFYALDIYNDEVREYLREVFNTIVNGWGFRLLKLDFLYAACIINRDGKNRGQIMSDAMDFLREISGDALILGCGVPLGSAFGKVDYCRIGCDVSLDWDDKLYMRLTHRERISTKNSILSSVFRRQLNGRAFLSDPDVFILRDKNNRLSQLQKQCLAEINALIGSVMFTSDNFAEYGEEQYRMFARALKLRKAKVIFAYTHNNVLCVKFRIGEKLYVKKYNIR